MTAPTLPPGMGYRIARSGYSHIAVEGASAWTLCGIAPGVEGTMQPGIGYDPAIACARCLRALAKQYPGTSAPPAPSLDVTLTGDTAERVRAYAAEWDLPFDQAIVVLVEHYRKQRDEAARACPHAPTPEAPC